VRRLRHAPFTFGSTDREGELAAEFSRRAEPSSDSPHEVIEAGSQLVHTVADDETPEFNVGWFPDLKTYAIATEVWVTLDWD
jgi:hypothetical protein